MIIRNMEFDEFATVIEWAAEEGWNPGLNDDECYYKADPKGFFVADVDGKPVGSISAVNYGNGFGFIGFYIVQKDFRKRGYGIKLWETAIGYLKDSTIGLDGVLMEQGNYRKSGFELSYRNIRFQGAGGGKLPANVVKLAELDFNILLDYDSKYFPVSRPKFLKCWINQDGGYALGVLEKGDLTGYGVIRPCRRGWKIGPLFCNSKEVAWSIFEGLASFASKDIIYIDVPSLNNNAMTLIKEKGMSQVFETARMYKGREPVLPTDNTYGVTSFEIG